MNVRHLAARTDGAQRAPEPRPRGPSPAQPNPAGPSFADALREARGEAAGAPPLRLSAHAEARLLQRDISMTDPERAALGEAVAHLDRKGAREALLLRADAAFVVSVPNRTVVTAVARDELAERAFTGIDSAMLL